MDDRWQESVGRMDVEKRDHHSWRDRSMSELRTPETQVSKDPRDIPTAIGCGTFTVFGVEVRCYTLSDGRAIVDATSMTALIEAMEAPDGKDIGDLEAFLTWQQEHSNG
jgi:hypothetical protein